MSKSDGPSIHSRMNLGGYDRELKRYGVAGPQFGRSDAGQEYRSAQDVEKELIDAARNDYDTRRTLEAAALSGKGKAQKILDSGFKSIDDVTNASNFMEKSAKRHGQGGDFSSASDYMGLTQSMVERDRDKQTQAINDQVNGLRDEFLEKIKNQKPQVDEVEVTTETSSRLADARNAVSEMEGGMFGGSQPAAPDQGSQESSMAQQMLDQKKKEMADKLKPANPAGL